MKIPPVKCVEIGDIMNAQMADEVFQLERRLVIRALQVTLRNNIADAGNANEAAQKERGRLKRKH